MQPKKNEPSDADARPSWSDYFMGMAKAAAARSEDESTRVGCVVVGPQGEIRSTGYNGFPRKVMRLWSRKQRPEKYKWTCHAEENAVTQAARSGTSLADCTAYTTCYPCATCTRMMIQAGIKRVVTPAPTADYLSRWEEDVRIAEGMAAEAGMTIYVRV